MTSEEHEARGGLTIADVPNVADDALRALARMALREGDQQWIDAVQQEIDRRSVPAVALTVAQSCGSCRFWQEWPDEALSQGREYRGPLGQCRRRPPIYDAVDQHGHRWGRWPDTTPADWCGEYQPDAAQRALQRIGAGRG